MRRMRRLQARTEVRFIIPLGRLTLLELSFGLSITELSPGPSSELLLPVADDLVLARDVSQSAEQRGNDDEDRPEEDEPSRCDRRDRPDRQHDPDRPCNSTEQCTTHPISVVLLRRCIDLLRRDRHPLCLEASQCLRTARIIELARLDLGRIGEDEVLDQLWDFTERLDLRSRLGAFIELLNVELTESITLREDITDDRAVGIRGPDPPIRAGICAEPRPEGTGIHGEYSNPAISGETEDQPGIGLD